MYSTASPAYSGGPSVLARPVLKGEGGECNRCKSDISPEVCLYGEVACPRCGAKNRVLSGDEGTAAMATYKDAFKSSWSSSQSQKLQQQQQTQQVPQYQQQQYQQQPQYQQNAPLPQYQYQPPQPQYQTEPTYAQPRYQQQYAPGQPTMVATQPTMVVSPSALLLIVVYILVCTHLFSLFPTSIPPSIPVPGCDE